ncbi:hypothetical protein BDW42DRAFT_15864 [Aspergillus taichungensis]|uniref:Carrier domain-containing protein n=1 Tax=Aspergillus taichungensis TaxID=482145 RepID=A0A2J5HI92_9EURO|nr:hypothetical protein BDW42DRAFT_15864 [Aspergillus taichungensis]
MSSLNLASELEYVEPCHFPVLRSGRVESPTNETYSSRLYLPKKEVRLESATEGLTTRDLCMFAFALTLKIYIGTDRISCGLLTSAQSHADGVAEPSKAYVLRADLDASATLLENFQKWALVSLTGSDGEIIGGQFHDFEAQAGFKHFNTTLCISGLQEQTHENLFNSDMTVHVEERIPAISADIIRVTLHYRSNLLDRWCAQNVLATFETILFAIQTNVNVKLASVNLISSRDEQTIHSWNAKLLLPARQTLNEHFEKIFRDNVDKESVYTSDGSFTYGELDDLSTVLAARLMRLGLKQNMVVPICMNKSRWGTCAMAAIWKAGGAIATMDPAYPDSRLDAIVEEVQARFVISDAAYASRFGKAGVHVISDLEDLPRLLETEGLPVSRADAWSMGDVKPDNVAFVAFTSGSSGRPKGVVHTHNRLTSEHQSYGWNVEYNGGARILQFGSYAFIAGVGDNFRALLHGATLCVPSETERTSGLAEFINRSRATRAYMTPSVIRTLDPRDVPSLKHLCVGGEPLGPDLERTWAGHVHFIQLYGASEGGFMIKDPIHPDPNNSHYQGLGLFPVGGHSWLVDPQDVNKLVPVGAVGEIIFESHELAAGYLNDPEKTAKTFINPPVWAKRRAAAGYRYLRMGDLARYETDGSMCIHGRGDAQVKIHGQRVELGDIESNLRSILPPRSEAIVELVKPFDEPDRPLLTAFCRLNSNNASLNSIQKSQMVIADARGQLEKVLPRHMVPRAFIIVKELPQNYKTDRRKLRNDASKLGYRALLASSLQEIEEPVDLPASGKEQTIAELWAQILRQDVKCIGRQSDFLVLGGDSLAAIKLVSTARLMNLELTTQDILGSPILKDMAQLAVVSEANAHAAAILPPYNHTITQRATDFQEWAALVGARNGGWIDHFVYDFRGRVDLQRLEESCKGLVEAHGILRTVFKLVDDRIYMCIPPAQDLQCSIHQVTVGQVESKSREIYAENRVSPLGAPIVRFAIIKASPTRHRLILRLSHAQYDGFCAQAFGEHLRLLYFSQPIPRTLPFHEYAKRIHEPHLIQDAESYWRGHLKNSQMPQLLRRRIARPSFENTLDGELRRLAVAPDLRCLGLNTATIVKAAWALTISSLSQSTDVIFGDFIAGRQVHIGDIETVVGPCVNFIPVRAQTAPSRSKADFLKELQTSLILAIPHQSLGFRHIIQKCTDWGQKARFSSIINFVNLDTASSGTETWIDNGENRLEVDSIYEEQQHDKTDLWLLCLPGHLSSETHSAQSKNTLDLYFRYSTRVYPKDTIDRIAALYCNALDSLATGLDEVVMIPEISDDERSFLVPTCD